MGYARATCPVVLAGLTAYFGNGRGVAWGGGDGCAADFAVVFMKDAHGVGVAEPVSCCFG